MRRFLYLAFLVVSSALAQPAVTFGPYVTETSHSFFSLYWETSAATVKRVEYGLTAAYGSVQEMTGTYGHTSSITHGIVVSGLTAGQTYHYRVCATSTTSGGGPYNCSGDNVVTLPPLPEPHPAEPIPPDTSWINTHFGGNLNTTPIAANEIEWDLTANGAGRVVTMNSVCLRQDGGQTLPQVLKALESLNGSGNLEIRIPAGAVCRGYHLFGARPSHPDQVIIRSAAPWSSQPPPGVRTNDTFASSQAILRSDVHWTRVSTLTAIANGSCEEGHYLFESGPPGFPLYECAGSGTVANGPVKNVIGHSGTTFTVPNHGYQPGMVVKLAGTGLSVDSSSARVIESATTDSITVSGTATGVWNGGGTVRRNGGWQRIADVGKLTTGAGAPSGPCMPSHWYQDTSVMPVYQAAYMCVAPNTWVPYQFRTLNTFNEGAEYAAVRFANNAARYRFVGLKITRSRGLQSPSATIGRYVNFTGMLVVINRTNTDIVFDRVDVDGLGYPQKTQFGFAFDGARIALINSRVRNIDWYSATYPTGYYPEAYGLNIGAGPGPGYIENNSIEATGITIFWQDGRANSATPCDYMLRRNAIQKNLATLRGNARSNGMYYGNRHAWESKRGCRIETSGNIFRYSWSGSTDQNNGAPVMITPTSRVASVNEQTILTLTSASGNALTVSVTLDDNWLSVPSGKLWVKITGSENHNGAYLVSSAAANVLTILGGPNAVSTTGTVTVMNSLAEVSDIKFAYNTFAHMPTFATIIGQHNYSSGSIPTGVTKRLAFDHNLFYDFNFSSAAAGGWAAQGIGGFSANGSVTYLVSPAFGVEDMQWRNNTADEFKAANTANIVFFPYLGNWPPLEGFVFDRNLVSGPSSLSAVNAANSAYGMAAFSSYAKGSLFRNNVICCGPVGNQLTANTYPKLLDSVPVFNANRRNYRKRWDSLAFNTNVGADINALEAAQGIAQNVRVIRTSEGAGRICLSAPDAADVIVRVGSTDTNVPGAAGDRCTGAIELGSGPIVFVGTQQYACASTGGNCSLVP